MFVFVVDILDILDNDNVVVDPETFLLDIDDVEFPVVVVVV